MKLIYRLVIRTLLFLLPIMFLWGILFYKAILNEVLDEMDDNLEDYSEEIIRRALGGDELPSISNGSNNQYFLTPITDEEAMSRPEILYKDSMLYIIDKNEKEPARILETVFVNDMNQKYLLHVATPSIDRFDLIESIIYWIIFLYALLFITVVLVNMIVFYRSLRPLYVLLKWLDGYEIGKENIPLDNSTEIIEFKKLNDAVIKNTRLHESYNDMQKQFIGNASHEMQTPVAICINRVELMMNDENMDEKHIRQLSEIHSSLVHLSKLNKSLLIMSRIDNGQYSDIKTLGLSVYVDKYIENLSEVYSYMKIKVEYKKYCDFIIDMNDTLAEMLVTNLLKNAFVHNFEGGRIKVVVNKDNLVVSNSGESKALDSSIIFSRFYQGNKKEGSTGLGLAIVKQICDVSSLEISYLFVDTMHTFIVKRKN